MKNDALIKWRQEGGIVWNKGKKLSLEIRKNISEAHKGQIAWNKGKKLHYSVWNKDKKMTDEFKKKSSEGHKGQIPWNTGKKRLDITGKNNWNWKGGITNKDRLARINFRRSIQKLIFERDNYMCQLCGSKGDLQVDHIQSWAKYIEMRFKIDNCRTVCATCHYKITFGKPLPKEIKGWGHNILKGGVSL